MYFYRKLFPTASAEKEQLTMMQKEIGVMKAMKDVEGNEPHPHILQMIGHYSGNWLTESVMLVLEIADLGNLLSYLRANRPKVIRVPGHHQSEVGNQFFGRATMIVMTTTRTSTQVKQRTTEIRKDRSVALSA